MVKWVVMISIRAEKKEDIRAIHMVNRLAFGQGDVAVLSQPPMAVLPEVQNSGIGSQLVRTGLEKCRELGHKIVVVVGHPEYYSRFGFVPARQKNLELSFPVPDEAFMVCELAPDALDGIEGKVKFPPEFEGVT
jgi:putative acetyltransferase